MGSCCRGTDRAWQDSSHPHSLKRWPWGTWCGSFRGRRMGRTPLWRWGVALPDCRGSKHAQPSNWALLLPNPQSRVVGTWHNCWKKWLRCPAYLRRHGVQWSSHWLEKGKHDTHFRKRNKEDLGKDMSQASSSQCLSKIMELIALETDPWWSKHGKQGDGWQSTGLH